MRTHLCIHGHFYQPPRESPWLEEIERQESARPFHDWNERICQEAYAPNAFSRILDGQGRIVRIVNNYSRISFNFGPTLLSWMERKAPETYQAVLEADRLSRDRFSGHGSAMAQAYNHMILPLASRRDKLTQILWGIRDFEERFRRRPQGMWLPETAVDLESLDLMAEAGIRFTVLAPRQAAAVRTGREGSWEDVTGERVDPSHPYQVVLPSGGEMAVFFYEGALSRAIAFENLLTDGGLLAHRLLEAGSGGTPPRPGLTHVATDGETYGHHHRHGEMALSYALKVLDEDPRVRLTNYAEYLEHHPPTREARIVEDSSWSCVHGVERWRSDCGCSTGDHTQWRQAWRAPLRKALDWLRDELASHFEAEAGELFRDPWGARDRYVAVVLDRSLERVDAFLGEEGIGEWTPAERIRALKLLEIQRHAMLMYTSCGWFFDDLARIETMQVLRYAARAIHLHRALGGGELESGFLERLAGARSNVPGLGSGEEIYRNRVAPERVELEKVAAHYSVASLFLGRKGKEHEGGGEPERVYCYRAEVEDEQRSGSGVLRLSVGRVRVTSTITRNSGRFTWGVLHMGDHLVLGGVREFEGPEPYRSLARELLDRFEAGETLETIRILDRGFRAADFSLSALFRDELERVVDRILEESLSGAEAVLENLLENRRPLMRFLAGLQIPQPRPFGAAGEFILDVRLERALSEPMPDVARAETLFREAELTGLRVDRDRMGYTAAGGLERLLCRLEEEPEHLGHLQQIRRLVAFIRSLPFPVDLWDAQNTAFRIRKGEHCRRLERARAGSPEDLAWVADFDAVLLALGIVAPPHDLPDPGTASEGSP